MFRDMMQNVSETNKANGVFNQNYTWSYTKKHDSKFLKKKIDYQLALPYFYLALDTTGIKKMVTSWKQSQVHD